MLKFSKTIMSVALFSVAVIATGSFAQQAEAPSQQVQNKSFDDYVRPYHQSLDIELPKANPTPTLDLTKPLSRIIYMAIMVI